MSRQRDAMLSLGICSGVYITSKKIPWKPDYGQHYFVPYISSGEADFDEKTELGLESSKKCYEAGLICQTADEAIKKAEKMLAALKEG